MKYTGLREALQIMSKRLNDDEIRLRTFGRFSNQEQNIDISSEEHESLLPESVAAPEKDNRKYSCKEKLKSIFSKKEKPVPQPQTWTGHTTILDVLSPTSVDAGSRDYIVVDGIYHSYLYIAGYGYRTKNDAAWLSSLVEAGDNIGLSFYFKRMPRDKILSRISKKTMFNRSRMRDVGDTRSDYEELDSAIDSGIYLKEGMNRESMDFYYMHTLIEITAEEEETLQQRVSDVQTLCMSMDMMCKRADYKHEQGFLSSLPILSLDEDLERKSRRNVLTDSLAAAFPFSSFEIYDPEGIFLGINKHNNSVAIVDIFDAEKYSNANACIMGMSGAGKSFLMQLMAIRLRQQGVQVFIIAPLKGHEFEEVCESIGGKYIRIAPSSTDCINILEIRKKTLSTDYEIRKDKRNDSILAEKVQKLIIFFSLIKNDITQDELNLIDSAIIRTYEKFGINYDNKSLFNENGLFKEMPTLKDLYEELKGNEDTKRLALIIEKFAVGSLSAFGGKTNVDLNNKYIVLDISEMNSHLKALGMFMSLDYVWDKAKESRVQKKVIFLDELWTLIGASGNRLAADYVLEIFKVIRGYGGSAIAATQDCTDFFALDDGKYGKAVINNSRIKIVLQLEEDEAYTVQKYLSLSDEETVQIIRNSRGEALLCANRNKICIDIKASPVQYQILSTQRKDLENKKENNRGQYMSNIKEEIQEVQNIIIKSIQQASKIAMADNCSDNQMNDLLDEMLCSLENACVNVRSIVERYRPVLPLVVDGKKTIKISEVAGAIEITSEGWVHITLNSLLPHCRYKTSNYLHDTLSRLIETCEFELPKYDEVFLAIVEHCDHTNRNAFDNDNKGWKMIPNALKGRLFEDDDQFHLSLGLFSKLSEKPACHIYVMPLTDASDFLFSLHEDSY